MDLVFFARRRTAALLGLAAAATACVPPVASKPPSSPPSPASKPIPSPPAGTPRTAAAPPTAPVPDRGAPADSPRAINQTTQAARQQDSTGAVTRLLPPIPLVDGPLNIRVVYPPPNHILTVRDSNFIFGSTGSGLAKLAINGAEVAVHPNGAFLAWLPVPLGDKPRYELAATKGGEGSSATVPVNVRAPAAPLPETGPLIVDRASVAPSGRLTLRAAERVRVAIRAPANARVSLHVTGGPVVPLTRSNGNGFSAEVPAHVVARGGSIVVQRDADSVSVKIGTVTIVDSLVSRFAELLNANESAVSDTDKVAILRPLPEGTYKWFLFPGTVLEVTGQRGDFMRVRLDDQLDAWVEEKAVRLLAAAPGNTRATAGNARAITGDGYTDLRISVTQRAPYLVEEVTPNALRVTLYGVTSNVDIVNLPTNDPSIKDVTWEQVTSDRLRITVQLTHAPYGYLAMWDRGALVLRVRRPPVANADFPLAGRVIMVDAGHPPIGSTGPTGLYEGDATLAVAEQLKPMLEQRGATVLMTRTTRAAVALYDRPIMARRANAEVLVSIHLNAHPDGANPLRTSGTGTYYFHPQSEPLARAVQRGMVHSMGLRDLGVNYDNLALARPTWLPSILCEGAFVIVPEQEAALRTPAFQKQYAAGIAEGLEEYFRTFAPKVEKR